VNAAFEDVEVLDSCLDREGTLGAALTAFSAERAVEARVLTQLSRSFDRGGVLALLTFILPLILDGIFHNAFPVLFAPNTLAMLQKPDLSFRAIRRRKRTDRALQLTLLAAAAAVASHLVLAAARFASQVLVVGGSRGRTPLAAAAVLPLAAMLIAAAAGFWRARVRRDVADVLAVQQKGLDGDLTPAAAVEGSVAATSTKAGPR